MAVVVEAVMDPIASFRQLLFLPSLSEYTPVDILVVISLSILSKGGKGH